jgi:hypothetical protein
MKSTGPRTRAGKAVVGLNNMKHGILSREVLVQGESKADLVGFGKRLRAQLAPVASLSSFSRTALSRTLGAYAAPPVSRPRS